MNPDPAPQLRLEPGGLRRHKEAGIGDGEELLHGRRVHGKGCLPVSLYQPLQLSQAADSAHELNSPVGPRVPDSEDWA